jgi:hypothetical protein
MEMLVDMLEGVIFVDALRRTSGQSHPYSSQHCLETAVDMLLTKLERPAASRGGRRSK